MRSIELRTTQNVKIYYEIAGLLQRVLAFLLDLAVMGVGYTFLSLIVQFIAGLLEATIGGGYGMYTWANGVFVLPLIIFYSLLSESLLKGRTIGKMALGIHVVRIDGGQPVFMDFLIRWIFRILDVYLSLGAVAAMLISGSEAGQRLGGVLSNTTVVKTRQSVKVSLRDLVKKDTLESYIPTYNDVRQYKESDMILMKQTLDRYRKFKNQAHADALQQLVDTVSVQLGVKVERRHNVKFIRTLIKDYIVLTR
ncbi:MAG: RDD family protein [Flavobacteriales bacterium]|nr:RDD family protein [Flavobacteriales bacterium]